MAAYREWGHNRQRSAELVAALGWLLNLDFAGSGADAPIDVIARSRIIHFAHHAFFLALVGASVWMQL